MIELYHMAQSPPSRAVRLTAEYIGVALKLNTVDLLKLEHQTPEYEAINPDKQIPFLVDGDFKLGESRAIMIYLVEKYGKNSKILPSDPAGRALVNQALQFDSGTLFKTMGLCYFPVLRREEATHSPEKMEKVKDSFKILDCILETQDYVAGRNLTIADISIIGTVTSAEAMGFDLKEYKNVVKWVDKVKVALPGYRKINVEGNEIFKRLMADLGF